jgi:guanylate kinase
MSSSGTRGALVVVSAPSGTGKTTVVDRLVAITPRLSRSRSYTSRPARAGEANGVDYHFIGRASFEAMIAEHLLLEWAEIYGNLYGTSSVDTEHHLAAGDDLVLVIDVQGARQVRRHGVPMLSVFLMPPSAEELEQRLRGRGTESQDEVRKRLLVARDEIVAFSEYDFIVINDDVDACAERLRAIIVGGRMQAARMRADAERIVAGFEERMRRA